MLFGDDLRFSSLSIVAFVEVSGQHAVHSTLVVFCIAGPILVKLAFAQSCAVSFFLLDLQKFLADTSSDGKVSNGKTVTFKYILPSHQWQTISYLTRIVSLTLPPPRTDGNNTYAETYLTSRQWPSALRR